MATTHLRGKPVSTVGELPAPGTNAPPFTLTGADLTDLSSSNLLGSRVVLNVFPSIDTRVCSASVRRFNQLAADLEDTRILCVSADLPFAQARFCGAEGIANVTMASSFRSAFGRDYGVTLVDGPFAGLLARAVLVLDSRGVVLHTQLASDVGQEPDYEAALAALASR